MRDSSSGIGRPAQRKGSRDTDTQDKEWLVAQHFTLQSQRPDALAAVAIESLHPLLRSLLFADGTVTRALEVHALAPTVVEVKHQSVGVAPREAARHLCIPVGSHSVQRRVVITLDRSPDFALWAESHLLPGRLPSAFFDALEHSRDGIGASFQRIRLEGWRELLWFGLSHKPAWDLKGPSLTSPQPVLERLYRVFTDGRPALLITESFPVECRQGEYRLLGL